MTMPFTHKKDEVRATGTLEARTPGDQAVQVLLYVIIALVALACVLPFIYVVAGSFATERELTERPFFLIPQDVSLNAYSPRRRARHVIVWLGFDLPQERRWKRASTSANYGLSDAATAASSARARKVCSRICFHVCVSIWRPPCRPCQPPLD